MSFVCKQQDNIAQAQAAAAQDLSDYIAQHRDTPVLFLVSGGSSLGVLNHIGHAVLSHNLHIQVVDERYAVAQEDQNFAQLLDTDFAKAVLARGGEIFDIDMQRAQDVVAAGDMLHDYLAEFLAQHPSGKVLALLGIGADGHTVGVMPYSEDEAFFTHTFVDLRRHAVGYDAGDKTTFPLRVTTTLAFLRNHVDYAIVYAVGADKRSALQAAAAPEGDLHATPARIMRDLRDVVVYTDQGCSR